MFGLLRDLEMWWRSACVEVLTFLFTYSIFLSNATAGPLFVLDVVWTQVEYFLSWQSGSLSGGQEAVEQAPDGCTSSCLARSGMTSVLFPDACSLCGRPSVVVA